MSVSKHLEFAQIMFSNTCIEGIKMIDFTADSVVSTINTSNQS